VTMAEGHDLPITFIIEDNCRSVDSSITDRLPSEFRMNWPAGRVIRYEYFPTWPHAGSGCKNKIVFKK
ncbi:MAG: hypothetical protein KGJ13_11815, partial [Patescibacteria group bacterium]|nr:hypothetical protein [Patescibacteria group bacterium]